MTDKMIPMSEAQAMVAAALEEAAQKIEGHCYTNNNGARSLEPVAERLRGVDQHHATVAAFIRALIPDAGAALERAPEKARAEGRLDGMNLAHAAVSGLPWHAQKQWALEAICVEILRQTDTQVVQQVGEAAIRARADHPEKSPDKPISGDV